MYQQTQEESDHQSGSSERDHTDYRYLEYQGQMTLPFDEDEEQ